MDKEIRDKKLEQLYHKVGLKNNLSKEEIRKIIESPYELAKERINELNLKETKSEEEFEATKTNFIFKYLGKLYTNYRIIKGRQKQSATFKQINRKKWEKKQEEQ